MHLTIATIALVLGLILSSMIADSLGFDFLNSAPHFLLLVLIMLPFAPFYLFFGILNPLVQALFRNHEILWLRRVWNFPLDCAIGGLESVISVFDKLGIN
jgi:hypothetical protein